MYVLYFYVVGCVWQPQINEHVMLCYVNITTAVASYIADMSSKQARTRTLGQLLSMNYFGYFIGCLAAGVLLALAEFDFIFGAVILVNCACVLTTIFCMRESVAVVLSNAADAQSKQFRSTIILLLQYYKQYFYSVLTSQICNIM